jgi:hypothetical protein
MEQYDLTPSECEVCGKKLDASTPSTDDGRGPVDGDISICFGCGTIGIFHNNKVRPVTQSEIDSFKREPGWEEVEEVQRGIRAQALHRVLKGMIEKCS